MTVLFHVRMYKLIPIYRNPRALLLFLVLFWSSCLITSLVQNSCWEVISLQFFTEEFLVPVHHRTVKSLVTVVALYHIHTLSSEGIYQVLLFCQVLSGILLPSSVVPLLQVSSSSSLMGPFKLSWSLGILALSVFVTMLIAQIVFLLELVCGHSSWVAELRGDAGSGVALAYIILLVLTMMSLSFIVYMVFMPFWSSTNTAGTHAFDLDLEMIQMELPELEEADSDSTHAEDEKGDEENDPAATSLHVQPIERAESNCDEAFPSVPSMRGKGVSTSDDVGEFAFTHAARRQFAAILDEFWGLFFDLHGNLTTNAQNLRLDILFCVSLETPRPFPRSSANNSTLSCQSTCSVFPSFLVQAGALFWARNAESNDSRGVPSLQPENSVADANMDQDEGGPPAIFYVEDPSEAGLEFEDVPPAESSAPDSGAGRMPPGLNFPESRFPAPGQSFYPSSPWSLLPYELHFRPLLMTDNRTDTGMDSEEEFYVGAESEVILLSSFSACIMKLLQVEGAIWLFRQKGGADEELINLTAEAERTKNTVEDGVEDAGFENYPPIPFCGDKCIWQSSLIISFGVWCIRRILELLLTENRPELWGKYTYVLNRLQGILAPGFTQMRTVLKPCQCVQLSEAVMPAFVEIQCVPDQQRTTAGSILHLLNQVEAAICQRKGRAGTPAGDIAFPKGKQNLISVFRRYKRKLSGNG
ncbi:putative NRAMP family protein [Dioscorea sansibarensis]